jgi:dipeptidyl aminopeptidase/acylaminoacyl peptidase
MSGTLWRVPAFGGEPVALEPPVDGQLAQHSQPEMLPGSREVLYTNWQRAPMVWRSRVEVLSIATGKSRILIDDASQPKFMRARGMLAFHQRGSLLAAPLRLDGVRLKPDEPPVLIATIGGEGSGAYPRYAVSDGGDLAIIPGEALAEETDLAWFGSDGVVSTVFRGSSQIWTLRLSPDAARVAYTIFPPKGDLWVLDIERSAPMKLTSTGNAFYPVWTPDGKRIAFQRQDADGKSRIEWTAADGSGAPETLYEDPGGAGCFPTGFSPDGRLLAISVQTGKGDVTDVAVVNIDGDRKATRLFETPADRVGVRFSPDGSMIAYCSVESGRAEIYIHPYPAMDKRALGSTTGGERPTWSADGKRLFYRYGSTIYAVDVSPPPNLSVGKPVVVLDKLPGMRYDAMPDGSRFIMGRPRGDWAPKTSINIVTNAVPRGSK